MKRFNLPVSTGTFDALTAGLQANGPTLFLGGNEKKVTDVSALVTVDAETNTITLAAKWQVSADATTWYDFANAPANTAATVLATGTGGADAAVTKVIPAPEGLEGWKYARMSVVVGVTTGTTSDTYSIGYSYQQN